MSSGPKVRNIGLLTIGIIMVSVLIITAVVLFFVLRQGVPLTDPAESSAGMSEIPDSPVASDQVITVQYETLKSGETHETVDRSIYDEELIAGDDLAGTVILTQGSWEISEDLESGEMDDFIMSGYRMINTDTGSAFNLTIYSVVSDPDNVMLFGESAKKRLENEGTEVTEYGDSSIGGYKAYSITGRYLDGMYLTAWYFIDSSNYLHYISVEYFPDDIASMEMVRDTYGLD